MGIEITLVGYRASGKSTIAPRLAESMGCAFVDLDVEIETTAKKTIKSIFENSGERAFRDLESSELLRVSGLSENIIFATGGGVIEREENRAIISNSCGIVVYLKGTVEFLQNRLSRSNGSRPSLSGKSIADEAAEILERRDPIYEAVSDFTVDISLPLEEKIELIKAYYEKIRGHK